MNTRKLTAAAIALLIGLYAIAADPPKREFRSVWMAAMGIDWPYKSAVGNESYAKQQLIEYIENFKRHNFTGICLQVRPLADALYRSSLEPWSASVSGTRGVDPGWDPLQFAIEECHKRGLELYAWINPFRIDNQGRVYTTDFDLEWREKGWELKSGKWTIFNIAVPEARQHCLDVIKEIYSNYDIDGMLFDDYFYPGDKLTETSAAGDYQMWKDAKSGLSIADWRRRNVNEFVMELCSMIQADRPDMRFGIGPAGTAGASSTLHGVTPPTAGSDWQYSKIYADPLAWLKDGSIDFIAPQVYWSRRDPDAPFTPIAEWWAYVADHFGRHNYISEASYRVDEPLFGGNNENGWNEFVAHIEIGRANAKDGAPGQIYYSAKQFDGPELSGLGDWLEKYCYQRPALVPALTWKEHAAYAAPAGASFDGSKLSWQAVPTPEDRRTVMRYTVYAMPMDVAPDKAAAADGDGIDGRYLVDVSYATTCEIPEELRRDHWFAVCVYDGYGFEHTPALVNAPEGVSGQTRIHTPVRDQTVEWDVKATWSAVEGATYIVELSKTETFSSLIDIRRDLTEPMATFDLSELPDKTPCYLRVTVCEPGKLYNRSEPRRFVSPTRHAAATAEVISPTPGEAISGDHVTLRWKPVADAERYVVQLGVRLSDVTKVQRTIEAPDCETTIGRMEIGTDIFEWRVIASGRRVNESVSKTFRFRFEPAPTGTYEDGYEIKKESCSTEQCKIGVGNMWIRTAADENCPLAYEADGTFNRSMVITPHFVFVTGRSEDSDHASCYLRQYDAMTGEHLRDLPLAEAENVADLPCNQIVKDSRDNIFVLDQSTSVRTRPLTLNRVDLATGDLTEIVRLKGKTPTSLRVDHAAVYGDVTGGTFHAFAAVSSKSALIRWTVEDFEVTDTHTATAAEFAGSAANLGAAPRLFPVSENLVWVDTEHGHPILYDFTTGKAQARADRLADGADAWPGADNGVAFFRCMGHPIIAFSSGNTAESGCRVTIQALNESALDNVPAGATSGFAPVHIPSLPMGTVKTDGNPMVVDAAELDGQFSLLAIHSPGNGLAVYLIVKSASVTDITAPDSEGITVRGRSIVLQQPAASLRVYNPSGTTVAVAEGASSVEVTAPGIYIVTADGVTARVVVR